MANKSLPLIINPLYGLGVGAEISRSNDYWKSTTPKAELTTHTEGSNFTWTGIDDIHPSMATILNSGFLFGGAKKKENNYRRLYFKNVKRGG